MKDYIPLLQTLLWVLLVAAMLLIFRKEVALFRDAMSERLRTGGAVEIGFFKLGEIRAELGMVENRVKAVSDAVGSLFLLTMSTHMFSNLEKIASGRFGRTTRMGCARCWSTPDKRCRPPILETPISCSWPSKFTPPLRKRFSEVESLTEPLVFMPRRRPSPS